MMYRRWAFGVVGTALLAGAACGGDSADSEPEIDPGDGGNYGVSIDPATFVERIDHPLLPFSPGAHWIYESDDGVERIEVTVLEETREVMGVTATIVRDTVTEDGELVEDTFDWYAQDSDGNVWYLGEDSTEYEDGEAVSTAGSWEAGVDGALPGIVMKAAPSPGDAYRQEYYEGEAEDLAEVLRLDGTAEVPFGSFANVLVNSEWTPLDPDVVEEKYYAEGVGLVLEVGVKGGDQRVELVTFEPGN